MGLFQGLESCVIQVQYFNGILKNTFVPEGLSWGQGWGTFVGHDLRGTSLERVRLGFRCSSMTLNCQGLLVQP